MVSLTPSPFMRCDNPPFSMAPYFARGTRIENPLLEFYMYFLGGLVYPLSSFDFIITIRKDTIRPKETPFRCWPNGYAPAAYLGPNTIRNQRQTCIQLSFYSNAYGSLASRCGQCSSWLLHDWCKMNY